MNHVFVASSCPHCSRSGQFPVELLGKRTTCRHCHKSMTVRDADSRSAAQDDSLAWWLSFTESGCRLGCGLDAGVEKPPKKLPR